MPDSFVTPWTLAHQALLSLGFSRQEYWNRLPFPPPGALPDPGTEPESSALAGGFFTTAPPGTPAWGYQAPSECSQKGTQQNPELLPLPIYPSLSPRELLKVSLNAACFLLTAQKVTAQKCCSNLQKLRYIRNILAMTSRL